MGRITTFLNPWSHQLKTSSQLSITAAVHMATRCPDSRRGWWWWGGGASAGVVSSELSVVKIKLVKIKAASYAQPPNQ